LRAHLKKQLPDYMVPSAFVLMEKLPLTPNGKIDRKALPASESDRIEIKDIYAGPRDPIEQMLTQIWAKVLRVRRVGVHDNFFELGGHSLLALRLVVEIEERFKKRLPLATMLQAPTVSELAEVLRKERWKPSWQSLVPVQPGGSKPPLFLMHSHGGNVLEYYSLASHLDADQPVYALQARGLDGHIPENQSIQEMAAAYVDEVRSLQPQGPYFVGGFCFGGLLALEAAQQLSAAGGEVALVVLIQTMHAGAFQFVRGTRLLHRWWNRTTKRIDLERENFFHRGAGYIGERGRRILDIAGARSAIALDHAIGNGSDGRAHLSIPYILQSLAVEHEKAYKRYVPHSYPGQVILFRASKQLRGLIGNDPYLGWHDLLHGNLEVCEVPGHQQNVLLEPNVSRLAEELRSRLQAVHERCMLAVETPLAAVLA
jgi:thioesterase domain-containing protein/acyl carrier protein